MHNAEAVGLKGFSEWVELSQSLVHGLAHAFTNRISSLSSCADLMALGDSEFTPEIFLPRELAKLGALNRVMRLLVLDDQAESAVELEPVIRDAIALQAQRGGMNLLEAGLTIAGSPLPVRVPRSTLLRLLVMLIDQGALRQHTDATGRLTVGLTCDDMTLTLELPCAGPVSPYMHAIAAECRAELDHHERGVTLRIPTLLALRGRQSPAAG